MNQTAGRRKHKRKNAKNVYNLAMREVAKRHISQVLSIERGGKKRQNQFEEMSEINRKKWLLVPVAVWVTMDYAPPSYSDSYTWILPDGEEYVPYTNLHCVVLTGEEYGQYRVADPINGWQTVEKETFWSSFDAVGRRAVTIAGNEEALA